MLTFGKEFVIAVLLQRIFFVTHTQIIHQNHETIDFFDQYNTDMINMSLDFPDINGMAHINGNSFDMKI